MKTPCLLLTLLLTGLCVQAQENATPSAAPAAAQKEMIDWLAATDAQWQATFKRDVTDVQEAERARLSRQYLAALDAALARASSASDLKGALALRDERKRFAETNVFPPQDEAADAAPVKQLRAVWRPQFAKMESDAALRAKTLHGKYDQALAATQAQLTQKQRLDDALLVQKKRDEVTAAWIKPAPMSAAPAAVAVKATPAPATPAPKLGTIPASPDTKSAFDAQLAKLTRTAWTWDTPMGKNTIKFAKDGTCVHTKFNGTFEIQSDNTVTIKMPTRNEVLVFDFNKGEYTGYDSVLKQKITGKRTYQK
jgi:hypothetical protein